MGGGGTGRPPGAAPGRAWTGGHARLAVAASPAWEVPATCGALALDQPYDDSEGVWRMARALGRR